MIFEEPKMEIIKVSGTDMICASKGNVKGTTTGKGSEGGGDLGAANTGAVGYNSTIENISTAYKQKD